jgi:redox-sensing transcriptional repressor
MVNRNAVRISKYKNALNRFGPSGRADLRQPATRSASRPSRGYSSSASPASKKGGYRVDALLDRLNKLLGKHETVPIVLVGYGKIGQALASYQNFEPEGLKVAAAFDLDAAKFRQNGGMPVLHLDTLKDYVRANGIRIGVLTVPDTAAQQVADLMIAAGIRGILNFAPIRLRVPENVVVSNVNFVLELENLIYYVNLPE